MMCSRHRPGLNGADAEPWVAEVTPDDPRLSMVRVMDAAERCRREIARGNVGEVVLILRTLTPAEHDLVEALILAEPGPIDTLDVACPECHATYTRREGHRCRLPFWSQADRGQALVEMALVLPILLLVIVAGLFLGLASFDRSTTQWHAQEAAYAASVAGAEDSACDDARAAAEAVSGRSYADCIGSDGLTMSYDPPQSVTITLDGGTWPVPFLDSVTVSGSATAIIRSAEPSPSPSGGTP